MPSIDIHPESKKRGYEVTDARVKWLYVSMGLLFVVMALAFGAMWAFDSLVGHFHSEAVNPPTAFTERRLPDGPRLQVKPKVDLKALRDYEKEQTQTYGWADKKAGTVRIPVSRAMSLLVSRGLPKTAPAVIQVADEIEGAPKGDEPSKPMGKKGRGAGKKGQKKAQ